MTHTIVVIGGNIAGLPTAHYILRHVITHLPNPSNYNVTVISPSSHSMFKIAAPRTLVSPNLVENEAIFASIPDGFKSYPAGQFTFIQGEAIAVDPATKSITVKSETEESSAVHYDSLIIATGTTPNSALWGLKGHYTTSVSAFQDIQKQLPTASSILIAGGGAAGVETAGEIAYTYKPASLTLLSGTTQLLPRLNNKGVGKTAESRLKNLGVKVIHDKVRVLSTEATADGKTAVGLSDGKKVVVDLFLDATGGVPNSRFLPETWLDSRGRVAVEPTTLRATQAPAGVYSVGDVASYSKQGILDATWAIPALGYSIYSDLKASNGKESAVGALKEKTYKQMEADLQFVPIGPKGGVGVVMGWQIPSWLVWLAKSRTFFIEKAAGVATGAEVEKA